MSYIETKYGIALILLQTLYCDSITAFAAAVVPDVNNIIDIFLLSILMLSYLLSSLFTNSSLFALIHYI